MVHFFVFIIKYKKSRSSKMVSVCSVFPFLLGFICRNEQIRVLHPWRSYNSSISVCININIYAVGGWVSDKGHHPARPVSMAIWTASEPTWDVVLITRSDRIIAGPRKASALLLLQLLCSFYSNPIHPETWSWLICSCEPEIASSVMMCCSRLLWMERVWRRTQLSARFVLSW